jgi:hypothetical protein
MKLPGGRDFARNEADGTDFDETGAGGVEARGFGIEHDGVERQQRSCTRAVGQGSCPRL